MQVQQGKQILSRKNNLLYNYIVGELLEGGSMVGAVKDR